MHCQGHFGKVKSSSSVDTGECCGYVTLHCTEHKKWWLSCGLRHKRVYSTTIISVEIRNLDCIQILQLSLVKWHCYRYYTA